MSSSKFWKNCLRWSHFLIKTQNYGLQLRTLLNSITHDFMTIFRNSCNENSGKFPRKDLQFSFKEITWLQSAAYNWTKTSITDTSLEVPRRERMLQNFKTPKSFCKAVSSSLMSQACSLEFPVSTKQTPRKKYLVSVLE